MVHFIPTIVTVITRHRRAEDHAIAFVGKIEGTKRGQEAGARTLAQSTLRLRLRRLERVSSQLVDSAKVRDRLDRWYKALNSQNFGELRALMSEIGDEDIVLEYPQSGEKIKGKANNLAVLENYPGLPEATMKQARGVEDRWVLTPSWTPMRITGTGDHWVVEGRVVYPNGDAYNVVDLFELRNDKVVKVTEYFAAPFPPAEWRARWVEKSETTGR